MIYILLSTLLLLIVFIALYNVYILWRGSEWFLQWLRGSIGFLLIGLIGVLSLTAFDIFSYKSFTAAQDLGSIRFQKIAQQQYVATFTRGNNRKTYTLYGDHWQLDARIIQWSANLSRLGLNTGYRLHHLSGRYLSLLDERSKPKKTHVLHNTYANIDIWLWLNQYDDELECIDVRYTDGVFLPMSDDAYYQISLIDSELIARPLNSAAKAAIALWR